MQRPSSPGRSFWVAINHSDTVPACLISCPQGTSAEGKRAPWLHSAPPLIRPQATAADASLLASRPPHCGPTEERLPYKGQQKDIEERRDTALDPRSSSMHTHTALLPQSSGPQWEVVCAVHSLYKGPSRRGAKIQPSHCPLSPALRLAQGCARVPFSDSFTGMVFAAVLGIHLHSQFLPSSTFPSSRHWPYSLLELQSPQLLSHSWRRGALTPVTHPSQVLISSCYLPCIPQLCAAQNGKPIAKGAHTLL